MKRYVYNDTISIQIALMPDYGAGQYGEKRILKALSHQIFILYHPKFNAIEK